MKQYKMIPFKFEMPGSEHPVIIETETYEIASSRFQIYLGNEPDI